MNETNLTLPRTSRPIGRIGAGLFVAGVVAFLVLVTVFDDRSDDPWWAAAVLGASLSTLAGLLLMCGRGILWIVAEMSAPRPSVTGAGVQGSGPAPVEGRFPTWVQAVLIVASGFVLALSSCFGFMYGLSAGSETWAMAGIGGFALGVLIFLAGALLLVWMTIRAMRRRATSSAGSTGV